MTVVLLSHLGHKSLVHRSYQYVDNCILLEAIKLSIQAFLLQCQPCHRSWGAHIFQFQRFGRLDSLISFGPFRSLPSDATASLDWASAAQGMFRLFMLWEGVRMQGRGQYICPVPSTPVQCTGSFFGILSVCTCIIVMTVVIASTISMTISLRITLYRTAKYTLLAIYY